jgi:MYXO-CTERM domain-containing protein
VTLICRVSGSLLLFFTALITTRSAAAETWDYQLSDQVQWRLWLPDDHDAKVIWGIYLIFNESVGDTRVLADREFIQRWAQTLGFGIIGTQFSDGENDTEHSDDTIEAMNVFAQMSGHPEIANAPVVCEGLSLGGHNAIKFATIHPERTIAYIGGGIGRLPPDTSSPDFARTPGFFYHGELDSDLEDALDIRDLFLPLRPSGVQVSFFAQWGAGHERLYAVDIGWKFAADVVYLRYPIDANPLDGPVELIDIPTESGWLADHQTWEEPITQIAPFADAATADDDFWLPTRDVAYVYRAHATEDRPVSFVSPIVTPTTPDEDLMWTEVQPGDEVDIEISVGSLSSVEAVEVFDGSDSIAEMSSPPYRTSWTAEGVGAHSLVAVATLSDGSQRTGYVAPVLVLGTVEHPGGGLPGGGGDDDGGDDGGDDGDDDGDGDDGDDDGGAAERGDGDGGCGCRAGSGGAPSLALLVAGAVIGLGLRRRRGRSS